MSLAVGNGDRPRGHSRSKSRDEQARKESARERPLYIDSRESTYVYAEDDPDDRYRSSRRRKDEPGDHRSYPSDGDVDSMLPGSQSQYGYDDGGSGSRPIYRTASPPRDSPYRSAGAKGEARLPPGAFPEDDRPKRDGSDERRVRYIESPDANIYGQREKFGRDEPSRVHAVVAESLNDKYSLLQDEKHKFLPPKHGRRYEEDDDLRDKERLKKKERDEEDLAYGQLPPRGVRGMPPQRDSPSSPHSAYKHVAQAGVGRRQTKYDDDVGDPPRGATASQRDDDYNTTRSRYISYQSVKSSKGLVDDPRKHSDSDRDDRDAKKSDRYSHREDIRDTNPSSLTVDAASYNRARSRDRRGDKSPGPSTLGVERDYRDTSRSRSALGSHREKSPGPSASRMAMLTIDTGRPSNLSLATAPASPLLESYRGTYQDCSPMPSPLLQGSKHPADLPRTIDSLSPLNSDGEGDGNKGLNRRARFHDPEDIASRLSRALKGTDRPDINPLIEILPSLSHEQVMELRAEYKRIVKTGSDRKGVNIAKHIRARLKDEDGVFMKACYAVALGKWESESYWANFWYQGDKNRRELLIESLMGRTNEEIRRIKDSFTDKKYDNSLTKCMKTELKEDKFKKAVLMVLEERRMEECDYDGRRLPIDDKLVDDDVDELHKAMKSEKGGETLMISIIVQRSDSHLRAVLQEYEHHYRTNFARDALKKSGNLVGELLAHILNGVINRPVRDALLLHHALTASRKETLRRELLVSRLVRFHWDPVHMQDVRKAYRERYGQDLQDAVRETTSSEWGLFCRELCIARMPNDVRRMERVEIIG